MLTEQLAERFAHVALANIGRDYPRRIDHLLVSPGEELRPRVVHPAFYGAFDWHSAVHMHWLLLRVLRLFPAAGLAAAITAALDEHLSPARLARELAYFRSPAGATFERPYGWAWLLELQAEALRARGRWAAALAPLAAELAARFFGFLASPYPIRAGSHGNSAFACLLVLDYARVSKNAPLEREIARSALRWYAGDPAAPIAYEPSLDDFVSPSLCEALLMREAMAQNEFAPWLARFAPQGFAALAAPPTGYDHADPKHSHLDGLCLSRAWCLARLGEAGAAQANLEAGLRHVSGGDYAGEHWLASFAALALGETP